jgi:cellulose biosynthesis protein BcsQ
MMQFGWLMSAFAAQLPAVSQTSVAALKMRQSLLTLDGDAVISSPTVARRPLSAPKQGHPMPIQIAMFNHKGGVSKTTTSFHLGWMLASLGKRVLLVDTDPQCNLTGLILGYRGEDEFESFYKNDPQRNIRSGLMPAFESQPRAMEAVKCVDVPNAPLLHLLPGHIRLSEYEVTLGIAQELSGTIQTLQNLPGAISNLLDLTAASVAADYILVDMNPSLSSINQNILMTSDYFIIPSSPDFFSVMAIDSLALTLPRWRAWSLGAQANPMLQSASYPYPKRTPRLLGTIIQKFRPRKGTPTEGFQQWIDDINSRVKERLVPELEPVGMTLKTSAYRAIPGLYPSLCLSLIADFNTLIAKSQEHTTPVFALTDAQLKHVGTVLENDQRKRDEFDQTFRNLANRVIELAV